MNQLNWAQQAKAFDEQFRRSDYDPATRCFVAQRNTTLPNGKRTTLYLHREIMAAPKGLVVDHRDHDTLNNQKENLRVCTHQENMFNRPLSVRSKTGFKGVTWHTSKKKYGAAIRARNKKYFLGYFTDKIEAAKAYNEAAKIHHGEFAYLNKI